MGIPIQQTAPHGRSFDISPSSNFLQGSTPGLHGTGSPPDRTVAPNQLTVSGNYLSQGSRGGSIQKPGVHPRVVPTPKPSFKPIQDTYTPPEGPGAPVRTSPNGVIRKAK